MCPSNLVTHRACAACRCASSRQCRDHFVSRLWRGSGGVHALRAFPPCFLESRDSPSTFKCFCLQQLASAEACLLLRAGSLSVVASQFASKCCHCVSDQVLLPTCRVAPSGELVEPAPYIFPNNLNLAKALNLIHQTIFCFSTHAWQVWRQVLCVCFETAFLLCDGSQRLDSHGSVPMVG